MRIPVLATILIAFFAAIAQPLSADTMQLPGPIGTITVDAPEIEIAQTFARASGGAKVVLPSSPSISIPGTVTGPRSKKQPIQAGPAPVVIEAPTVEVRYPAYEASGGVTLTQGDVTLTAQKICGDFEKDIVQASGGVVFKQGSRSLVAEEFEYNYATKNGHMMQAHFTEGQLFLLGKEVRATQGTLHLFSASATTCDKESPDYRITAREIIVTPDRRLIAKHVSVWLGKVKIITLPRLTFSLRGRGPRNYLIPRPGFDRYDGFYLGMAVPVIDRDRFLATLRARATTNEGFEAKLSTEALLSGHGKEPLLPLVTGAEVELRDRPPLIPRKRETGVELETGEKAERQFRAFADLSRKEPVYDVDKGRILLDREPEIGLRYVLPGLHPMEDSYAFRSEGRVSWGRFHESTTPGTINRFDTRVFLSPSIIKLGNNWSVHPVGLARWSHYDTGDDYTALGLSVDVTKLIRAGTFGTIRYINYFVGGTDPLDFDDVDIPHELQGILQYEDKKNYVALSLRYNVDTAELYDWEFTYGRTLHCIQPRIYWRNRFSELGLNVKILGF